ncbi:MAG: hypothetical protein PWP65_680 [Clostridia bacterium]|nr:hypothetical protein [Clostridia bacterium]
MTRIIGIIPNMEQVGGLIDSLRNAGFDRKDIVVSDFAKSYTARQNPEEIAYLKTERDGLWESESFADFLAGLASQGVVVAVEAPRHEAARIREILEQNGAARIIQD